MDLDGIWRALEATEDLRRVFPDPDLSDADWEDLPVPGHWQSSPDFAGSNGPVLYRRRFETSTPPDADRRLWLQLDGVFYDGDVWLDRSYLGDTQGYFFPHTFEVTEAWRQRRDHLLAIEVACTPPSDRRAKRNLTGVFEHWDCFDRDWNPGGLWRGAHLEETGPVRLHRVRAVCAEASAERATLDIEVVLDASRACTATIETSLSQPASSQDGVQTTNQRTLASGLNQVAWRLSIDRPDLWWPASLGNQPLYDLTIRAQVDDQTSDTRQIRTGLRQVRMTNFITTVNGERLYLKGANQGPTRRALGEASAAEMERDVVLAREAGLDLLRIHGHVSRPELYEAADRHGLLLWQDLPLQWGYSGVRRQAVRQAVEAVDLLGHHPSIAIWCGHNEPLAVDVDPSVYAVAGPAGPAANEPAPRKLAAKQKSPAGRRLPVRALTRLAAGQVLPTWNKTALDRSIRRALEKADRSRPVVSHSGILPHPAWGTDSHLYWGWYQGDERDFPSVLARFPVLARFVSEFGAQAVPESADFCQPERWPALDWEHLARAHALQRLVFDRYVPPADYQTFEAWQKATQAYQATLIRFHVETLRRLKYRPGGGFCLFCFGDGQPAVTWSVLDHQRIPKAGFEALAAACAPVIAVADRPAVSYQPGETLNLNLHVVSDLRTPIPGARLRAELSWPGGQQTWLFEGDIPADDCVKVGTVRTTLPDNAGDGRLDLDLELQWTDRKARNRYDSDVRRIGP
jgi:beta-mannosidase